jgi:hypothetical protein
MSPQNLIAMLTVVMKPYFDLLFKHLVYGTLNYFRFGGPYFRNVRHSSFQVNDFRQLALLKSVASRVTECPEHDASHYIS